MKKTMATERRLSRLNELIKREIARIIDREIDFAAGTLVTVTRVETSGNLIEAKVYVSVLPEANIEGALKILKANIFELQQILNKEMRIRPVPKISFHFDRGLVEAHEVYKLLGEISPKQKKKRGRVAK